MSYVKNYNVGEIQLDLPTSNYFHELPLLSFADIHGEVNLSLVFNYGLKAEGSNPFNIATGYKLNMQKRLIMSNNAPIAFQNESGKVINLNSSDTLYAFDDDSQRTIRRTGSTYELENLDFSKEIYDQVGKIKYAYDKYGTLILSYAYNSGGILTSITYRNEKTITFTYDSSNRLKSIAYSGKTISLTYTTSGIKLNHYTGVKFTLSSSGMEFSAIATATENSTTVSYTTKIEKDGDDVLAVSNLMNSSIINTTTYKFPGSVASYSTNFLQVEITDHYGARKRIQFQEDKPLYSYEIGDSDAEFDNDKYSGTVQIHSVFNNTYNVYVGGKQSINDGYPLEKANVSTEVSWETEFSDPENCKGLYILSGWIKLISSNPDIDSDTIPLYVSEDIRFIEHVYDLPKPPLGQWSYFAVSVPIDKSPFCAYIHKYHGNFETRDFRLCLHPPCDLYDDNTTPLSKTLS